MSLAMTTEEREAFLADLHVGVISVEQRDGPPLAVPIWYDYEPGGELWVLTGEQSLKTTLLRNAGRFSLCAQREEPLYQYVSVEGPIVGETPADLEADTRPMAHRYFGQEFGDQYVTSVEGSESVKFSMRPERWWTVDYTKFG